MDFESAKINAEKKLKVADHLLGTTYSFVKDPKLLLSVIDNLFQALDLAITTLVDFEKKTDNSIEKIDFFRRKIIPKYSLEREILDFYVELKDLLEFHKNSGMEFSAKEKFIMADNDYNLKSLKYEDVKNKYLLTKKYVNKIFDTLNKLI